MTHRPTGTERRRLLASVSTATLGGPKGVIEGGGLYTPLLGLD